MVPEPLEKRNGATCFWGIATGLLWVADVTYVRRLLEPIGDMSPVESEDPYGIEWAANDTVGLKESILH